MVARSSIQNLIAQVPTQTVRQMRAFGKLQEMERREKKQGRPVQYEVTSTAFWILFGDIFLTSFHNFMLTHVTHGIS